MPRAAKKAKPESSSKWLDQLREARNLVDKDMTCSFSEMQEILGRSSQKMSSMTKEEGFPVIDRGSGRRKAIYPVQKVIDFEIKKEKDRLAQEASREEKIRRLTLSLAEQPQDLSGLTLVEQRQVHELFTKLVASEVQQGKYYPSDEANEYIASFMMRMADMFDDFADQIDPNGQFPTEIMDRVEKQGKAFQQEIYRSLDEYVANTKSGAWPSRD